MQGKKGSGRTASATMPGYVIPHQGQGTAEGAAAPSTVAPSSQGAPPGGSVAPVFVNGPAPEPAPGVPAHRPSQPEGDAATSSTMPGMPGIEVEYIREAGPDAIARMPSSVLEIWTRNRVYHVDGNMRCVAVVSRDLNEAEVGHSLLGARLAGGQRRSRSSSAMEVVFPFPVPGTEAVFKHENKTRTAYGQTSTVERVVLRIRKFRVGSIGAEPAWDDLTGRFQVR